MDGEEIEFNQYDDKKENPEDVIGRSTITALLWAIDDILTGKPESVIEAMDIARNTWQTIEHVKKPLGDSEYNDEEKTGPHERLLIYLVRTAPDVRDLFRREVRDYG